MKTKEHRLIAFVIVFMIAGALGLAGCNVKSVDDSNDRLKKLIAEQNERNDTELMTRELEQGGFPGTIKIAGVVVNDGKLDPRITALTKSGIGKSGKPDRLPYLSKPALSSTTAERDLSRASADKSLIAIGCDEQMVIDGARERGLDVRQIPAPLTENVMLIEAKTLILCGNLDELKFQFLNFNSDELILSGVNFTQLSMSGALTFSTNKLVLLGANKISAKGIDSSMPLALVSSLELNVLKKISSDDEGRLLLTSVGASYKADSTDNP